MQVMCINGHFIAEGDPTECAMWTYGLILAERTQVEKENEEEAKKEAEALIRFTQHTLDEAIKEAMKKEREDT